MAELASHVEIGYWPDWHESDPEAVEELTQEGWIIDVQEFVSTDETQLHDQSYTVWILRKPTLLEAAKQMDSALASSPLICDICAKSIRDAQTILHNAIEGEERKERDEAIQ